MKVPVSDQLRRFLPFVGVGMIIVAISYLSDWIGITDQLQPYIAGVVVMALGVTVYLIGSNESRDENILKWVRIAALALLVVGLIVILSSISSSAAPPPEDPASAAEERQKQGEPEEKGQESAPSWLPETGEETADIYNGLPFWARVATWISALLFLAALLGLFQKWSGINLVLIVALLLIFLLSITVVQCFRALGEDFTSSLSTSLNSDQAPVTAVAVNRCWSIPKTEDIYGCLYNGKDPKTFSAIGSVPPGGQIGVTYVDDNLLTYEYLEHQGRVVRWNDQCLLSTCHYLLPGFQHWRESFPYTSFHEVGVGRLLAELVTRTGEVRGLVQIAKHQQFLRNASSEPLFVRLRLNHPDALAPYRGLRRSGIVVRIGIIGKSLPGATPPERSRRSSSEEAWTTSTPTPNRELGRRMAAEYGWTDAEWACLDSLWKKESQWDHTAENPTSGAYGIPQAHPKWHPRTRMPWYREHPRAQIEWGMDYIQGRYRTPCRALDVWVLSGGKGY